MPTIAIFCGIIIQMLFEDHNPPHLRALYGGDKALVRISDGEIIRGRLPRSQVNLGKVMGGASADRVNGELASCPNRRPMLPYRRTP